MNMNMNEKGRQTKLLAAIAVLAMVVCAFVAIIPAFNVNAATEPSTETIPASAIDIDSLADLDDAIYNETTKTITVPGAGLWINLTADIGTADAPVDVRFVLDGDLRITADSGCEMYVQYNGTATENAYTVTFNQDDTLFIVDGATVNLDVNTGNNTSVFNNMYPGKSGGVKVVNDATLNVEHTGSGTTWLEAPVESNRAWLIVDDSTVNFNGTQAIQEIVVNADNATINFNDVLLGMSVLAGSDFNNTKVNVNGADLNGIFVKGDISLSNNSEFNVVNASRTNENRPGVMIYNANATTITMDNTSSIDAGTIGVTDAWDGFTETNTAVNISGGSITGEFTAPLSAADTPTATAPAYNLTGTTIDGRSSIASGATVTGNVTIGPKANLAVYGKLNTTTHNEGTISVMDKGASIPEMITGTGSVDTSSISGYEEIEGEIYDVTTKGVGQTTTLVGDTVILAGSQLTIKGKLIINEGVTLTIEDGAQVALQGSQAVLENNGTILVQSNAKQNDVIGNAQSGSQEFGKDGGLNVTSTATVENNGSIIADYVLVNDETTSGYVIVIGTNCILKNAGTVTINDDNIMYITGTLINDEGSTLNVDGALNAGNNVMSIDNAGTVNIDGTVSTVTINLTSQDAAVNVTSLEVSIDNGKLTVTDSKVTSSKANTTVDEGSNTVELSSVGGTVGGLTIKTVLVQNDDIYYRNMELSGAVVYTFTGEREATVDDDAFMSISSTTGASTVVSGTLAFGEDVDITLSGNMNVSGTMTMQKESSAIEGVSNASVTVTGTVVSAYELNNWTMNAAMYRTMDGTTPTYYYTTLENAVASGATAITTTGKIVVLEDVTIPSETTVTQKSGIIQVGDADNTSVTVTVANGGKIDQKSGTVDVNGTLFVENKSNGLSRNADITSEVKSETETSITYTNLAKAIANAGSESVTITLNGGVEIRSDLTIPSNVTVDTNEETFKVIGATLTIDGTLYLNGTAPGSEYTVEDVTGNVTKVGKIVLNGYIKSNENLAYTDGKALPAGAYYIGAEDSLDYITSVNNSQNIISAAEDATIDIYGTNTAGDISYTGTVDLPATINVNGKLTVSSITLSYADLVFMVAQEFDGSIGTAEGEATFADASIVGTFSSMSVDDVMEFVIEDAVITATDAENYSAVFSGESTIAGQLYEMTVDGNVIASGLTITDTLTVNGTLTVDNGKTLDVQNIAVVGGTLAAAEASENAAAGNASVVKLYVGIDPEEMSTLDGTPAVNGSVSAGIAYVIDGGKVTNSITDVTGIRSTEFYIEDALWMTAYTSTNVKADVSDAPVVDADFIGWNNADGKMQYSVAAIESVSGRANNITVGTPDKLYAEIDYNIYTVNVTSDNGIGTIAIDGIVMQNVWGNIYSMSGLAAGEHTLSYTLKNGYEGTAVMTVDGQNSDDYTFDLSGTDTADRTVEITLSGITPIEQQPVIIDGGSDMGLTDYLLIILVILIVVMAIMVAMRLMRS